MKSIIRWAIGNSPAMNTLMVSVMIVGVLSLLLMRREVFPEFELEIILVSVPYPGASPAEVEEGICQKIEESVRAVDGIKKQTSVAQEGAGHVVLELEANVPDVQKILNEVRSEIDRIPSFPELAEDPEVKQITLREPAIHVSVMGPESLDPQSELLLRDVAEQIRSDLLQLPSVSQANIIGAREYQIDIEIPEAALRKYGLSLLDVARLVRQENLELPGGSMKTDSEEVLLRGKNKHLTGEGIAKLPLVTQSDGVVLTVEDLGTVRDEFDDSTAISRVNGKPGLVISVDRTSSEDLLAMVGDVKAYVANYEPPTGYELNTWGDRSVDVRDRMELLSRNGLQGLLLVFLVLAVFLELRLAFWVALGIPIAVLGACGVLLYGGQTLNMLSMFAFLMALGIVVDDAIVIGENIYEHRNRGKDFVRAAVDGTFEVLPSVLASVATTIIAFLPLMFVSGVMGKFIAVLPVTVIAMLVISLIESTFILPCHLAHRPDRGGLMARAREYRRDLALPLRWTAGTAALVSAGLMTFFFHPLARLGRPFRWINRRSDRLLQGFVQRVYVPSLDWGLRNPATVVCAAAALLILSAGLVRSGRTPFTLMPKLDSNWIEAKVVFPDGTPASVTDQATGRLEDALFRIDERYAKRGTPLVRVAHRAVGQITAPGSLGPNARTDGSHVGSIFVELAEMSQRPVDSQQIIAEWRRESGRLAGTESLTFGTPAFGPGGKPIEFKLIADQENMPALEAAVERTKAKLGEYEGVYDIADDSRPGKMEYQLKIKDEALAMGIPLADLASTVRASYYGEEVMRLQRGRHEVKLMVRYPREDRRSLADFEEVRIRSDDGAERPLTELADVNVMRGYSEINRVDQRRSITITADLEESVANAREIVEDLQAGFMPGLLAEFPAVDVRWEGQQEQTTESVDSLKQGLVVALLAMFALLTLEFRSYVLPLLILAIIPFGAIGAIWGHWLMGMPLTLFSVFGLVALTGVVVNDSIVLIDFINARVRAGMPVHDALVESGQRRFRPVLLTSLTTIAGLMPILLETSFQAQILIPMAASLCFGLMLATLLVLILIPTFYLIYSKLTAEGGVAGEHLVEDSLVGEVA